MAKTILITGGTQGIGRGVAKALAASGHRVVVTSRKQRFDSRLALADGRVVIQHLDVEEESSVQQLFQWLDNTQCKLDVLVNNAGIGVFKPLTEITTAEWRKVIDVNLTGTFLCTRAAVQRMVPQGGGRILNIGSIVDKVPLPGQV